MVHSGCLGGGHYVAYTRQLLPWNQTDNIQQGTQGRFHEYSFAFAFQILNIFISWLTFQVIEDTAASTDVNPQKDGSHWFYYSDTTVGRVSETTVCDCSVDLFKLFKWSFVIPQALASQAYVLYYRLRM